MLGSIVNAITIVVCSLAGVLIGGRLKPAFKEIAIQAVGMSVIFIGAVGTITNLQDKNANPVLFIISLVIGGLAGQAIDIEAKVKRLGDLLEAKFAKSGSPVSQGFVSASILFCVGSMAILGSIESGVKGVHNILFAKSVLDGVISVVFASTMGIGVVLSAGSVLVYEGGLTLLSHVISPYMSADMIREISIVGGVLVAGIGIDMLGIRKINVANLLPAILVPVIYYLVLPLFH